MVIEYTNKWYQDCVELTKRLNIGGDTVRHYPTDKPEIAVLRSKKEEDPVVTTLLYMQDNQVIGLLDCNVISEEKYLQIISIMIFYDLDY